MNVLSVEIDGKALLLNLATGEYFELNETANEIWRLLASGIKETADIARLLSDGYSIEYNEAVVDAAASKAQLALLGLIDSN